jgi:N-acyl-D-aspartate/D-glutamate deacylase
VLGRYVREQKALTLVEAIRKMTLLPARRLERLAPMMKKKGRIREGADADITVFDPDKVIDRSTYEDPSKFSEGMRHVLVNGVSLVREGQLQTDKLPGRAVRAPVN